MVLRNKLLGNKDMQLLGLGTLVIEKVVNGRVQTLAVVAGPHVDVRIPEVHDEIEIASTPEAIVGIVESVTCVKTQGAGHAEFLEKVVLRIV